MFKKQAVFLQPHRFVDVAIVGAGFSGSMLAVHLADTFRASREIALIEKCRCFGPGIAYGTDNQLHLLNVPAGRMGAYPEKPHHFLEWLKERRDLVSQYRLDSLKEGSFVPRKLYGLYVEELVQRCALQTGRVHRFEQEALDLTKAPNGWFRVLLGDNTTIFARKVVLAVGNFPPGDPVTSDRRFHLSRNYISDPWSSSTLRRLAYARDILILGSGLTALDLIVSLSKIKRSGKIYLLSRRGHFPHRHAPVEAYAFHQSDPRKIHSMRHLLRAVRNEVSLAAGMNIGWRSVIDALRPHTQAIWQHLDLVERRRFLRHLRPYWECHRHRAAPEVLDVKDAMVKAGRLRCYQGRLESLLENEHALHVKFRNRSGAQHELTVDVVVNCTGPECNYHKLRDPLIIQLFLRGLARPDPLFLGFDVNDQGQLLDAAGHAVPNLHTLGSPQKGRLLETTAVPELRQQAFELAGLIAEDLQKNTRLAVEGLPAGHSFDV